AEVPVADVAGAEPRPEPLAEGVPRDAAQEGDRRLEAAQADRDVVRAPARPRDVRVDAGEPGRRQVHQRLAADDDHAISPVIWSRYPQDSRCTSCAARRKPWPSRA